MQTWLRLNRAEVELQRRTEQLTDCTKGLNCLYDLSNLIVQPDTALETILESATQLLPPPGAFRRSPARGSSWTIVNSERSATEKLSGGWPPT